MNGPVGEVKGLVMYTSSRDSWKLGLDGLGLNLGFPGGSVKHLPAVRETWV